MKKIFTLFAASLLFLTTALAQEKGTHSFELGGGINAYGILGTCGGPVRYFGPGAYNGQYGFLSPETANALNLSFTF